MTTGILELLIESYRVIGTHEPDRELQRLAFARMGELIMQRAPKQVERMELERGLR